MSRHLGLLLVGGSLLRLRSSAAAQAPLTQRQYAEDFEFCWQTVRDNYAYFDKKQTDWDRVHALYRPQADTLTRRRSLVRLLENMLGELYDHHAGLSTNRADSPRLVPTGADLYAEFDQGRAIVREVRAGFGAERAGVRAGDEVREVNGLPLEQALRPYLPRALRQPDAAARTYALNVLLAGRHDAERRLRLQTSRARRPRDYYPDRPANLLENRRPGPKLEARRLGSVGYLKVNNSLGDNGLIAVFDSALTAMQDTKGLILDLRETPSGGNTTVARAILGRFITAEQPYQVHELVAEERAFGVKRRWAEWVAPRPSPYRQPVVVLAGRWTGSMGEGLTIAFDALKRATVVGTALARLNGAIYFYRLPNSSFGFTLPAEKLYHLSGAPRETYVPPVVIDPLSPRQVTTADAALAAALRLLD